MRESRHWGAFPECLAQALPNAHFTLLDLAGNGLRNQERSACAVAAMVQDCRTQLRQRGLAPPYRLLALSMGAMVVAHWSVQYPQEISHQVLINTSMRPFSPFYQRLRPRHYLPLLRLGLGQASAARQFMPTRLSALDHIRPVARSLTVPSSLSWKSFLPYAGLPRT